MTDADRWGVTLLGEGAYCLLISCESLRDRQSALALSKKRMAAGFRRARGRDVSCLVAVTGPESWVQTLLEASIKLARGSLAAECGGWFVVDRLNEQGVS